MAGACITILKAFFNTDNVVFPNSGVLSLYSGSVAGQMTPTGELPKLLAVNVGFGRDHAGIHWRADWPPGGVAW